MGSFVTNQNSCYTKAEENVFKQQERRGFLVCNFDSFRFNRLGQIIYHNDDIPHLAE